MSDAGGEDAGLAGAGAGEHQQRPIERLDRLALLWVERIEIMRGTLTHGPLGQGRRIGALIDRFRRGKGRGCANLGHDSRTISPWEEGKGRVGTDCCRLDRFRMPLANRPDVRWRWRCGGSGCRSGLQNSVR